MTTPNIPEHLQAMNDLLQSVAGGKVHTVRNPDHLIKLATNTVPPFIGVVYDGLVKNDGDVPRGTAVGRGIGGRMSFTLYFVVGGNVLGLNTEPMAADKAHTMLTESRAALREAQAPNGQRYSFEIESYVGERDGKHLWRQRWTLPVPLI